MSFAYSRMVADINKELNSHFIKRSYHAAPF